MEDEDGNNVRDTNGYEKSGVQHAYLSLEDLLFLKFPVESELLPAITRMGN